MTKEELNDENTWGMMHEEMYVPKELVRDLFKESYALSEHYKDQLTKAKHYIKELVRAVEFSYSVLSWQRPPIKTEAEQFLKDSEVEK